MIDRARIRSFFATVACSAVAFYFLLLATDVLADYARFSKGIRAFGTAATLIPTTLGVLVFVILISGFFTERARRGDLLGRFCLVASIQMLLFPVLEAVRVVLFLPLLRSSDQTVFSFLHPLNYIRALAGGAVGMALALLSWVLLRRIGAERAEQREEG